MDTIWRPDLGQGGPKYLALAQELRTAIRSGTLPEGAKLPPVRDLAWDIKVTPGTVARAYQIVTHEGLLQATVGRGTYVAAQAPRLGALLPQAAESDNRPVAGRLDMRSPNLPELGQLAAMSEAMARISRNIDAQWLDYVTQSDEALLRDEVCTWLATRELGNFDAEDLVLTHGGQNGVSLILQCCLRGDRPVVLVEDLCYPGFRYAARMSRAEVHGIELDDEGMRPDALEAACRRYGPQVLCLTPEAQNPTTARMSDQRRREIVSIARQYNLQIIEDECYSAQLSDLPALRALAPERVWYIGSLSKSVSAALRFGFVICPDAMGDAGRLAAQQSYFALSKPVSALCLDLFRSGAAEEIRGRVVAEFAARSTLAARELGDFDIKGQSGLPFVWMSLPQGWRASTFARRAEEAGILLRSADQYAMVTGRAPNAVRMALAGDAPRDRLEAGFRTLAGLLRRPPNDMAV
ncbi:aminotransferase class I/II-fold pyridoxal phosphate-dependent enzyme [bacterium]|nr:aminotransferase class I/II-fold pyridoxal phosphate-dependent enzyme [bacterium]